MNHTSDFTRFISRSSRALLIAGLTVAVTSVLLVAPPPKVAHAQDNTLNRARDHFNKAQEFYKAKQFAEAAAEFQSAYEARPFAQFLFNMGACHEKMNEYEKAVDFYQRFLKDLPNTPDRKKTERRIEVLKKEAERLKSQPPPVENPEDPDATPPVPQEPSAEVAALGELDIRGLVVIESEPQGAYIYLDSKKGKPLSRTPWSGTLEGEHTIFIERRGYKPIEKRVAPDADRLLVLQFGLAEEDYLGWIDISANIPGAAIYIDDKSVGVYRRTPFSGNLTPGKHKIWITMEGYDESFHEVDIVPGETHKVSATLKGSPVGYLNFRGREVEKVSIYLDGKLLCERGPCRKAAKQGTHRISVKRSGYKSYSKTLEVQQKTEITVRARLEEEPGRADAVWAYLFTAAFTGGGVWLGMQATALEDELRTELDAGTPPLDADDPRIQRGKYFSYGADAAFAAAGVSLITAIYYTFREKGKPSTGTSDIRAIALEPQVTPTYAGVGMGVRW